MRNLTEYNDQFILNLIKQNNGNPWKCTANVQYGVEYPRIVPFLIIYQDYSEDWDIDDRVIFCEKVEALDFCGQMHITIDDLNAMVEYYSAEEFQQMVNDLEYEAECIKHEKALQAEYDWYIKARQMGWE